MLDFFTWWKKPDITSTMVFNERFCHSAGEAGGETYEINKGTTEIIFIFERFDTFLGTYLFQNPYLPDNIKNLIQERKAVVCAQLVQNGLYVCASSVGPDGHIRFRPESLKPLQRSKRLRAFSSGAIAFGIFQPDTLQFHVLWATMYKTGKRAAEA